jgi:DNA-binding NtrC family response regulator
LLRRLARADWPGNIRQLQNEIKRLTAFASGSVIGEDDLSEEMPPARERAPVPAAGRAVALKAAVEDLEREMISETLRATGNSQQQTAKTLGLSRQGLLNKLKRYHLPAQGA